MKEITLHKQWIIKAPTAEVFRIMTDFEKWPIYFPKVAESIKVIKHEGNNLEMDEDSILYKWIEETAKNEVDTFLDAE